MKGDNEANSVEMSQSRRKKVTVIAPKNSLIEITTRKNSYSKRV